MTAAAIPATNATLRTMVLKAKAAQMNNDAIDRAIKRGTGQSDGGTYESITYEGYAPGGVGLLIDALTDNRNRTGADVRNVFSKLGGSLAEPGAVGWQFSRKGVIIATGGEDEVMMAALDAGADDVVARRRRLAHHVRAVRCVRRARRARGCRHRRWCRPSRTMVSSTVIEVADPDDARKILRIVDALEDNDDVQDVYSNFDISDEIMEAVG